jgi:hypothetical protein
MVQVPQPEIRLPTPSAICSLGARPHLINGFLVQLLRQHFCDPSHFEEPVLRNAGVSDSTHDPLYTYKFRPDLKTGIVVDALNKWDPTLTDRKPAVLVKRTRFSSQTMSIAGRSQGSVPEHGFDTYQLQIEGGSVIFCVAHEPGEADLIAFETFHYVSGIAPIITNVLKLNKFRVDGADEIHRLDANEKQFVVPISVSYTYEDTWILKQDVPVLKSFSLETFSP